MSPLYWVLWSALCAVGTGLLVFFVMQSHMDVVLSKQREELAAARATLVAQRESLENSLKTAEESTRRKAMDEFLADIRIEERHYTREHKVLFMSRKMLVRQERIFFRNIPLSDWVEHEMALEEGVDPEKMAQTMSVFVNAALLGETPESAVHKLLR
jgi:uncharacterized membrane protein YgaE (UPF0421/DUF939 family)